MPSRFNIVLVVAANAALAGFVPAQQPDTVRVAPIVITATRVPVGRDESPATVDVITGEQLRLRGITSLSTALEVIPG
ncbi:MAG TPA: hypothetical protein VNS10_22375, partial [Gemmatimonadaceae bacterium]|nr:hypothetical protein [Gemmatimonadaceae bacterium]